MPAIHSVPVPSRARPSVLVACALLLAGCPAESKPEDPSGWYTPPADLDVTEPVLFTDVNYDFTGDTPIADLPSPDAFQTWFAPDDAPASTDCQDWGTSTDLPAEISGIVTLLPRFYYKTDGCLPPTATNNAEKYYGSYFVQDQSGGYFVLGDSKVAHFDMGDRVTLRIRAIKNSFDQLMVVDHDVVDVQRGPEPVYYEAVTGALGPEHVSKVVRVEGTVATEQSTFGEVYLDSDDGSVRWKMGIDAELNRRGVSYPVGERLQVTGPVLYSFSEYTIEVLRVGQITEL